MYVFYRPIILYDIGLYSGNTPKAFVSCLTFLMILQNKKNGEKRVHTLYFIVAYAVSCFVKLLIIFRYSVSMQNVYLLYVGPRKFQLCFGIASIK